uniref:26S proteasome non-ATPase regulatory subunit 9 n=1 Tax=Nilaparvata lugens TaxID=108931 RepID=A0A896MAP5_NILLU|nr:26S proteasome regulatory particle assembly chaperone 2 [Nilaparvata lugens]
MVGMDKLEGQNFRDTLLDWMGEKFKIEKDIRSFNEILQQNGVGMDDPLVDAEGYPRNDIDVYQVRLARNKIICLNNDLKDMIETIERGISKWHKEEADKALSPARVNYTPFLRVGSVSPGSPADIDGLRAGDLLLEIGTVNGTNYSTMADVGRVVEHSIEKALEVRVLRHGRSVNLLLVPKPWSGQGNLGCVFLPIEAIER